MKKGKSLRIITTALAVFLTAGAFTTTAKADDTAATVPEPTTTPSFYKYLVVDNEPDNLAPNLTFTYTIEPGSARNAVVDPNTGRITEQAIKPGPSGISLSSDSVSFTADKDYRGKVFDTLQAGDVLTQTKNGTTATVNLNGKKYYREQVSIDTSHVSFSDVGIYRWKITETAPTPNADGLVNDDKTVRYLDAYVTQDDNGGRQPEQYILHNSEDTWSGDLNGNQQHYPNTVSNGSNILKDTGFTSVYTTNDLKLENKVTGNQASHKDYFKYTVTLSDGNAGTEYKVTTTGDNAIGTDAHGEKITNTTLVPERMTAGQYTVYLKYNESIIIHGLTQGMSYTIQEDDYTNDGYTTTAKADTDVANRDFSGANLQNASLTSHTYTLNGTLGTTNDYVQFTNERAGVVPTGIILSNMPFILLIVAAAAGIAILTVSRRKNA